MIFFPDRANFSAFDKLGVDLPSVRESTEKIKNLNLIKMAQKRNKAKRKFQTTFFAFHILDLKIVPSDSELNYAPGN